MIGKDVRKEIQHAIAGLEGEPFRTEEYGEGVLEGLKHAKGIVLAMECRPRKTIIKRKLIKILKKKAERAMVDLREHEAPISLEYQARADAFEEIIDIIEVWDD